MVRQRLVDDAVKRARGERLRTIRESTFAHPLRKVTQAELGRRLGFSGSQISKYENGTDLLDAGKVYLCAKALDRRFLDIFEPGRFELDEATSPFDHGAASEGELRDDLWRLAKDRLSPERLKILRDVMLELLSDEETAPSLRATKASSKPAGAF